MDGAGYRGAPTEEVGAFGQPLIVSFPTPVTAFGVNIRAFAGAPDTATVTVYAPDGVTVIGTISGVALSTTGTPVFVGWQAGSGIGAVQFTPTTQVYSPPIENLEFGGTVGSIPPTPAPPAWMLIATGLAGLGLYRYNRVAGNAQTH